MFAIHLAVPNRSLLLGLVVVLVASLISVAQAAPRRSATDDIGTDFVISKKAKPRAGQFIGAKTAGEDADEDDDEIEMPPARRLQGRARTTRQVADEQDDDRKARLVGARSGAEGAAQDDAPRAKKVRRNSESETRAKPRMKRLRRPLA